MPDFANGFIPPEWLHSFCWGYNDVDGAWTHCLSPATYQRHLAMVDRAKSRTGRDLMISDGWGAYRPYEAQIVAQLLYGDGAATPGTSSHGGFWEGRQTMAMDYSNWEYVYSGDYEAFAADATSVGLTPGMIMPERGYPYEPWHIIDFDPWGPAPAFARSSSLLSSRVVRNPDMPIFVKHSNVVTWPNGYTSSYDESIYNVLQWVANGQNKADEQWMVDIWVAESWTAARALDNIVKSNDIPVNVSQLSKDEIARRVADRLRDDLPT